MSNLISVVILSVFLITGNPALPAFPTHGHRGLTKLEYVTVEIYKTKLTAETHKSKLYQEQQRNNADVLITQAIEEAKKLIKECHKR